MSCINLPTVLPGSPSKTRGQIQVILGPMFSGKSTELMRRVRRFQIAQYKCLVIKYAKDTRYSSNFSTHDRFIIYLSPQHWNTPTHRAFHFQTLLGRNL
uniref:Thymidine kinase n=1 Tax=Balaenoptera musculus TaxID=9771 RepID=A0A8C0E1Q0_BALMU